MVRSFRCRVQEHHEENLMTARNLGVIFGRKYRLLARIPLLHGSRDTAQLRSCVPVILQLSSVTWLARR